MVLFSLAEDYLITYTMLNKPLCFVMCNVLLLLHLFLSFLKHEHINKMLIIPISVTVQQVTFYPTVGHILHNAYRSLVYIEPSTALELGYM